MLLEKNTVKKRQVDSVIFQSLNDTIGFKISSPNKEAIGTFVFNLLVIFSEVDYENQKIKVQTPLKSTDELKKKLDEFVDQYKTQFPQINALSAYFRKLKKDEEFYFLPNPQLIQDDKFKLYNYLRASEANEKFENVQSQFEDLFEDLIKKYKITVFGPRLIRIGQSKKQDRICRFCENKKKPTSFKSKAHAIPEGLGIKQ